MKEIPVYLTLGMLESGKTGFIRGILEDHEFTELKKCLVIRCEQGEEEYDDALLEESNAVLVDVEDEALMTADYVKALVKEHKPSFVVIEWNGMWQVEAFVTSMPKELPLVQIFTLIDATTYDMYLQNMRGFLMNFVKFSDVVIINRCTAETKKASIRRTMKGANGRIAVIYENADGVSDSEVEDDLPFDFTKDPIVIEPADFGIWYLDVMENPAKYAGKNVTITCMAYRDDQMPEDFFYGGRYAMTCCEADIQYVGVMVRWQAARKLPVMGFCRVTGKVYIEANPLYSEPGPVITANSIMPAKEPEDRLVYFN